jgi:hypothetical protein
LTARLAHFVGGAINVDEVGVFGEDAVMVGYLWNGEARLLRPCFGEFPPDAWLSDFPAGRGIAGHAFRFGRPAAWHRASHGDFDVIMAPTIPGGRDYSWILCLPIKLEPDGASVGVVGLAGTTDTRPTTMEISELARSIATRSNTALQRINDLWIFVNVAFWGGVLRASSPAFALSNNVRDIAEQSVSSWLSPTR